MNTYDFDLICIGGGSAGLAAATKASQLGYKVALIEARDIGGTCLHRGCIPKKLLAYCSQLYSKCKKPPAGFTPDAVLLDWSQVQYDVKQRLQRITINLESRLAKDNIQIIRDYGLLSLIKQQPVVHLKRQNKIITAQYIILCNGGIPTKHELKGQELTLSSDDFFELQYLPKSVIVLGSGYIACELGNIWHNLGVDTTIMYRNKFLKSFDNDIQQQAVSNLQAQGIKVVNLQFDQIMPNLNQMQIYHQQQLVASTDCILSALGRKPDIDYAEEIGLRMNHKGEVIVDEQLRTNLPNLYAVGDITDSEFHLTPTAIWQSRHLVSNLFGQPTNLNLKYPSLTTHVPTAVFCSPEIGSVGLTEAQAKEQYPLEPVKVFKQRFSSLVQSYYQQTTQSFIKLVCVGTQEKVVGCHLIAEQASEMIQCLALAVNLGITRQQIKENIPLHPSFAEEIIFTVN